MAPGGINMRLQVQDDFNPDLLQKPNSNDWHSFGFSILPSSPLLLRSLLCLLTALLAALLFLLSTTPIKDVGLPEFLNSISDVPSITSMLPSSPVLCGQNAPPASNPELPAEAAAAASGDSTAGSNVSSDTNNYAATNDCDLFHGRWVVDKQGPLYSSKSCPFISEHENCQANGRLDKDYENWRWQPSECDLPRFNPREFLKMMRGKRVLFVGDSLARNQMESMVCLLSLVEIPVTGAVNYTYATVSFVNPKVEITRVWSSWLMKEEYNVIKGVDERTPLLHLESVDRGWLDLAKGYDVVIVCSGHWFGKPSVYAINGKIVGGQSWKDPRAKMKGALNNTEAFRISIRHVWNEVVNLDGFKGLFVFRTYSPDHYEHGKWNTGGSCAGNTKPRGLKYEWRSSVGSFIYQHQLDAYQQAIVRKGRDSRKFMLMDIMPSASKRVDGHPGERAI